MSPEPSADQLTDAGQALLNSVSDGEKIEFAKDTYEGILGFCNYVVGRPNIDRPNDPMIFANRLITEIIKMGEVSGSPMEEASFKAMLTNVPNTLPILGINVAEARYPTLNNDIIQSEACNILNPLFSGSDSAAASVFNELVENETTGDE